jgi:hypothetical protein
VGDQITHLGRTDLGLHEVELARFASTRRKHQFAARTTDARRHGGDLVEADTFDGLAPVAQEENPPIRHGEQALRVDRQRAAVGTMFPVNTPYLAIPTSPNACGRRRQARLSVGAEPKASRRRPSQGGES